MKTPVKAFPAIALSALLASPVAFAEQQDVTCESNMASLSDNATYNRDALSDSARQQIDEHIRQAGEAQSEGDEEGCVVHSSKALQEIRGAGSSKDAQTPHDEQ
ncbi:MAG: hypothetical protein WC953_06985 [Pseudomonas sp.]